jgi:GTP-binding protein
MSEAHPAIADYPFTTIHPGLGVVEVDAHGARFVAADLPGMIEGASQGRGLGLRFLRHATRCRVLAVVVDVAAPDPAADLDAVAKEMAEFDVALLERLVVVVANKIDLDDADAATVDTWAREHDAQVVAVSARVKTNIDSLVAELAARVTLSFATQAPPETFAVLRPVTPDRVVVTREGSGFRVRSERAELLVAQTAMDNPRAVRRLQKRLRSMGVEAALAKEGAHLGDDVFIGDRTFEFYPEESARA